MNTQCRAIAILALLSLLPFQASAQEQPPPPLDPATGAPQNMEAEPTTPREQRPLMPGEWEGDLQPGPARSQTTGRTRLAGASQLGGPIAPVTGDQPSDTPFKWGKLHLRPHASYRVSYGDSIQAVPGEQVDSWIHEFSPGILFNLGEFWSLDYTPTMRWYSDPGFDDGVDHVVMLRGRTEYKDWNFGLAQGFASTSQPLIETGIQTGEETWSTSLSARRALNQKLFLELGLAQDLRYLDEEGGFEALGDAEQWSTMNWIDYQYVPRLAFGLGAGFTYDAVELGSDMTSEQVQARTTWRPGPKLDLIAAGGVDIRQFVDSEASGMVTPIYSLTAAYRLYENTLITVIGSGSVEPSYYSDAVTQTAGITAGLIQRLLGKLSLGLTAGYSITTYESTAVEDAVAAQGLDDYSSTMVGASLGMPIVRRGDISVFYNKTWNDSDAELYDFNPQTTGVQISYRF